MRSACRFFFQAEDGIRYGRVTGVQTCALPILYATTRWEPILALVMVQTFAIVQQMLPLGRRSEERRVGKERKGGKMWITYGGQVGYDASTLSAAFEAQLQALSPGQTLNDTFTYAIGMSIFFSSRRRHTIWTGDWSSDVCSSDLVRDNALGADPRACDGPALRDRPADAAARAEIGRASCRERAERREDVDHVRRTSRVRCVDAQCGV